MGEWLSNLTAFRDVLLLLINLGIFAALCAIAGLLTLFLRGQKTARETQSNLLERFAADKSVSARAPDLDEFKKARSGSEVGRLETLLAEWLDQFRAQHRQLLDALQAGPGPVPAPVELLELIERSNETSRRLFDEWTQENGRRNQASNELRDAIRDDLQAQALRLKQLLDLAPQVRAASAPTPTVGTLTAPAPETAPPAWEQELRSEVRLIVDKLDRMSERIDEIFRI